VSASPFVGVAVSFASRADSNLYMINGGRRSLEGEKRAVAVYGQFAATVKYYGATPSANLAFCMNVLIEVA